MRRGRLNKVIRMAIVGDPAAQEELCRLYAKTILYQTRLLVQNKADAEDVAQRVMIEMIRGIGNLNSPFAFRSWLQRIIVNTAARQNAQTQKDAERSENLDKAADVADQDRDSKPAENAENKDFSKYISGYLDKLPPMQSVALVLYYYEQLSYREIAETLGITTGSVSSTMSKAKKNLKKLLSEANSYESLGIVYMPPLVRRNLRRAVLDEVNDAADAEAVERMVKAAKLSVAAGAVGAATATGVGAVGAAGAAGGAAAAGVGAKAAGGAAAAGIGAKAAGGGGAAVAAGVASSRVVDGVLIGVISAMAAATITVGTFVAVNTQLDMHAPEDTQIIEPEIEALPENFVPVEANLEVVYSHKAADEGEADPAAAATPIDPLDCTLNAYGGEQLQTWVIANAAGESVANGSEATVDISAMDLSGGEYRITWDLVAADGRDFQAFWDFTIS